MSALDNFARSQADTPICPRGAINEYKRTLTKDGEPLPVIKSLKIIRSLVVNFGVMVISVFFVANGGDPTIIGALALLILGAYNGLEISDYLTLLNAVQEVQEQTERED